MSCRPKPRGRGFTFFSFFFFLRWLRATRASGPHWPPLFPCGPGPFVLLSLSDESATEWLTTLRQANRLKLKKIMSEVQSHWCECGKPGSAKGGYDIMMLRCRTVAFVHLSKSRRHPPRSTRLCGAPKKLRLKLLMFRQGFFTGHETAQGSGQEVFKCSRVEPDWVGSGRVGSGRVGSGRVGSGRVTLSRPNP